MALANIDEVIALIKGSANRIEARQALMDRFWEPGVVTAMLDRAGAGASRPEDLDVAEWCALSDAVGELR